MKKRNKRNIRDEQKGIIFIVIILVVVAVLSVIFKFALKTDTVKNYMDDNEYVQTLFVVEDEDNGLLFSFLLFNHSSSYKAALLNIPGYTGAIFDTIGRTDKIAAVYKEKGIEGYKREVEKLLGLDLEIPFYSIIKVDDFAKMCDYIGGLRVFISEPIDCVAPTGERWLLPSGAVTLDGDKIKVYLNYRQEYEDELDVQERYQNCAAAFISGIHNAKFEMFDGDNFKVYSDCIASNVTEDEEKTLFNLIADADAESITRLTITGSIRHVDNQELLIPDNNGEFIKQAIQQTVDMLTSADGSLSSRRYRLEIQNGTTTPRLAKNTATLYQKAGYDVLAPVNAEHQDYEETVVIDHKNNPEIAKIVGDFIRCTNIREIAPEEADDEFYSDADIDFTIILGSDFDEQNGFVIPK